MNTYMKNLLALAVVFLGAKAALPQPTSPEYLCCEPAEQTETLTMDTEEATSLWRLKIVPTRSSPDQDSMIDCASINSHFDVVLTNTSESDLSVWREWCSWGYYCLTFDVILSDGETIHVKKEHRPWRWNHPDPALVKAGDHIVYSVRFDDKWAGFPKDFIDQNVKIKAIFEIKKDDQTDHHQVWTGKVESPTVETKCCLSEPAMTSETEEEDIQADSEPNNLDIFPASWKLNEIAEAVPPYGVNKQAYVLAWKIEEDDRPLRIESCLVLAKLAEDKGYHLSHLFRHDKKSKWKLSTTHFSGKRGTKYFPGLWVQHALSFKNRPTNAQLYKALSREQVNWSFDLEDGWKIIGCGVCEKNWNEVIGEKPTRFLRNK